MYEYRLSGFSSGATKDSSETAGSYYVNKATEGSERNEGATEPGYAVVEPEEPSP